MQNRLTIICLASILFCASAAAEDIIWPLGGIEEAHGRRTVSLSPLFSWETDEDGNRRELDILWPLAIYRERDDEATGERRRRLRIFPFLERSEKPRRDAPPKKQTVAFPFYFSVSRGPDEAVTVFFPFYWRGQKTRMVFPVIWSGSGGFSSIWPIYGAFENWLGHDSVRYYLWPLWTQSRTGAETNTTIAWPFLRWSGGDRFRGLRLWPLVGWERSGDKLDAFMLWPIGYYTERYNKRLEQTDKVTLIFPVYWRIVVDGTDMFYLMPLWGQIDSPERKWRPWFWPFYAWAKYHQKNYYEHNVLFPFGVFRHGEGRHTIELWPLLGHDRFGDRLEQYFLWPLIRNRHSELPGDYAFHVQTALPFVARSRAIEEGVIRADKWTFFPFYYHERNRDGSQARHALWPFYFTRSRAVVRNWFPLFRLYEKETQPDGGWRRNALWNMLQWRDDDDEKSFRLNLFLAGYSSRLDRATGEKSRYVRLLGFPLFRKK